MLEKHWRLIAAAVACVVAAGSLWFALKPTAPKNNPSQPSQAQSTAYKPGGSNCDSAQISRLSGQEAVDQTNKCAEAAEQHRLVVNDLIQQTRAADAAAATARLTYDQGLIALGGMLVGFFTLIAAVLAALYAKKAADAADQSVAHSLSTSQQELRAYLVCEDETVSRSEEGDKPFSTFMRIKNVGSTPASNFTIEVNYMFEYFNGGLVKLGSGDYRPSTLASGATSDIAETLILDKDERRAFRDDKGFIKIYIKSDFTDNFGEHWSYRQSLMINGDSVKTSSVYTEHCEHVKTEKAKASRPSPPRTIIQRLGHI